MEIITTIPGFLHIDQDIFKNLDGKDLMACRCVNKSWKNILDNPIFWCSILTPKNIRQSWKTLVQTVSLNKNFEFQQKILVLLIKLLCKKKFKASFGIGHGRNGRKRQKLSRNNARNHSWTNGHLDVIKFLVAYTETPNSPFQYTLQFTPIQLAFVLGHQDVVEFLKEYCQIDNIFWILIVRNIFEINAYWK